MLEPPSLWARNQRKPSRSALIHWGGCCRQQLPLQALAVVTDLNAGRPQTEVFSLSRWWQLWPGYQVWAFWRSKLATRMPGGMRSPNSHKGRVFEKPQGYETPVAMWKARPVMPKFSLLIERAKIWVSLYCESLLAFNFWQAVRSVSSSCRLYKPSANICWLDVVQAQTIRFWRLISQDEGSGVLLAFLQTINTLREGYWEDQICLKSAETLLGNI